MITKQSRSATLRRIPSRALLFALAALCGPSGCDRPHAAAPERLTLRFPGVTRIAIAPIMNFSGETSLDPVRAADLLASEMAGVDGITIVPVNRVVVALQRQGLPFVQSPAHAAEICRSVGSDAILVPALTEYNPYPPMVVGLLMELYVLPQSPAGRISAYRDPDELPARSMAPAAQVQLVLNAAHDGTVARVKHYAAARSASTGPFAWRRYLVAQDQYLRFCFYSGLHSMLNPETYRMALGETSDE